MLDEIALQREVTRATKAKLLLESELLSEAFQILEQNYITAWRTSPANAEKDREKLFMAVNVLGKVRDHLTMVVQNGSIAQADLQKLHAEADRKKRFGII